MKTTADKLKLIFVPFLLITICFVCLYSFLNWLLFIELNAVHLNEDIRTFWLAFALPWIPVYIWLRPRIRLLNLIKKNNDNLPFLYQFVAVGAIAATTIVAQNYLETATGKQQQLASIKEINQNEKTKYYSISRFYLYKEMAGLYRTAEVSGKQNDNLTFYDYYVVPLFEQASDTSKGVCEAWLGIKYQKTINNRLSDTEKEQHYQTFTTESQNNFKTLPTSSLSFTERIGYTNETEGFLTAVKTSPAVSKGEEVILKKLEGTYSGRSGNKLPWIFGSFGIGAAVFLLMILIPSFNQREWKNLQKGVTTKRESDWKEMVELFRLREGYKATPLLLISNLLVYLIMVFAGLGFFSLRGGDLLSWGANFRPLVVEGEVWRLLSSVFLHGGLMHLLSNIFGLVFIGMFLEPKIGTKRFVIIYLLTGIAGSLTSIWWHPATVSVGASGAIFGIQGVFLALLLRRCFPPEFSKAFLSVTLIFLSYNLIMGLKGGIDNAAHIGGLLSGFFIGLVLSFSLNKQENVPRTKKIKRKELM